MKMMDEMKRDERECVTKIEMVLRFRSNECEISSNLLESQRPT